MVLFRILRLRYEVDMLQPNRTQAHVNSPFAHYHLHLKVPIVVLERETVLRAKLYQRVGVFPDTLLVCDRDGEYDVLLGAWFTVPVGTVACVYGILISREPDKLSQTGDLRAVPAVECPIAPAGPEGQAWPRKCHNRVPLGLCQHTFFQRSFELNTPAGMVPSDRSNGAHRTGKWCRFTA